ncbi:hypothetical protein ABTY98_28550 [Streptomyces sp. NPDC096040]|uniref:hypothetical protein n=1 Tax=Streptomyces sp. NPDC096040 TaxID=3155541 RepID=UPI00332FA26E
MTTALATFVTTLGPIGVLAMAVFLLLFVGVVLPAVWSRHAYRRSAAQQILTALIDALFRALRRLWPLR